MTDKDKDMRQLIVLLATLAALTCGATNAAEIRLRQQCIPHGTVIVLGDVAEIYSADATQTEKMAAIELFPAPAASQQRVLRVREVQDMLMLRGLNLAEHQFSGASQVVLASGGDTTRNESVSSTASKRAHRRVQEALLQYLQSKSGSSDQLVLQFEMTPALARAVANPAQQIAIGGGSAPWTGMQHFQITTDSSDSPSRIALDVQVIAPTLVVAAMRSISRGAVIRESDLTLVREVPRDGESSVFHSVEEVAGKQTTRAIPDGKILAPDDLQSQTMIHKGDVVTVYARSAGIKVRTTARAKDDGSLGDLVTLETMNDRKQYQARVCGAREAEVLAQAVPAMERNK